MLYLTRAVLYVRIYVLCITVLTARALVYSGVTMRRMATPCGVGGSALSGCWPYEGGRQEEEEGGGG